MSSVKHTQEVRSSALKPHTVRFEMLMSHRGAAGLIGQKEESKNRGWEREPTDEEGSHDSSSRLFCNQKNEDEWEEDIQETLFPLIPWYEHHLLLCNYAASNVRHFYVAQQRSYRRSPFVTTHFTSTNEKQKTEDWPCTALGHVLSCCVQCIRRLVWNAAKHKVCFSVCLCPGDSAVRWTRETRAGSFTARPPLHKWKHL